MAWFDKFLKRTNTDGQVVPQFYEESLDDFSVAKGSNGAPFVQLIGSTIQQPVDIQNRKQTTLQTHNAVSVGASGGSKMAAWLDCDGYDQIAFTVLNDAATANALNVYWSNDGTNEHGAEFGVMASASSTKRAAQITVKARYIKVELSNADSGAAHTMSAWAYLKV